MKKNIIFLSALFISFISFAQEANKKKISNPAKEGYVKALIIKEELENCGFLIQLKDKKKLMPDVLSDDFKKNKLKVWVKYTLPKTPPNTTCMAGKSVNIVSILKR